MLPNGDLANGMLWADLTNQPGEDALDGMKVDKLGNVYVAGPGGLWIFAPSGKIIGRIIPSEEPHNLTWGDADGKTPLSQVFTAFASGHTALTAAADS